MTASHDFDKTGYNEEERHFKEQERALLAKRRAELDAARKACEADTRKTTHWMKCPKCGADLAEVEMDGVMIDRCGECGGIFFDRGELDLLLQSRKPAGLLASLRSAFK